MLDLQNTHKISTFVYNFRIVSNIVTEEQMPVKDKLYVKDDKVKLPIWLSKHLFKEGFLIIEEFENMNQVINRLVATQKLNKNNLVPIEQDFYMLVNDYFNFYIKYKLKYLEIDNSLTENEKIKKEMEIKDHLELKKNQVQNLVDTRKKILLLNSYYGYNKSLVKNMSFEECIIYSNVCKQLNSFNNFFALSNDNNI